MPANGPPCPAPYAVERLTKKLRLATPLIAVYDAAVSEAFAPLFEPGPEECCFSFYERWLAGETLVLKPGGAGCKGGYRGLGVDKAAPPPFMAHFLTDGVGAPKGEGLRAAPEIAQAYLDRSTPPPLVSGTALLGPLRLEQWDKVRSITFLVDPDRLAALMTLAGYWSPSDVVAAPFGSGCSFLWKALDEERGVLAVIGATDIAMRRYLPASMMTLSVGPAHFARMVDFPENAFLNLGWWDALAKARGEWK